MRMTVDTMETEIILGNVRELRGNFVSRQRETEEGTITEYECDYYRTKGNETFEELHQQYIDSVADKVRYERDMKLYETDWTQVTDSPLYQDSDMLAYRQGLRDITEQDGFPFDVIWPVMK